MGGSGDNNVIEYITMANTGNATDFGDLVSTSNTNYMYVVHNGTYAWMHQSQGAGRKQQITMATAANATELGFNEGPFGGELVGSINVQSTTCIAKGWIAATG